MSIKIGPATLPARPPRLCKSKYLIDILLYFYKFDTTTLDTKPDRTAGLPIERPRLLHNNIDMQFFI